MKHSKVIKRDDATKWFKILIMKKRKGKENDETHEPHDSRE